MFLRSLIVVFAIAYVRVSQISNSHWPCSGVLIVNFEHISHLFLEFISLTLDKKMLVGMYWKLTWKVFYDVSSTWKYSTC